MGQGGQSGGEPSPVPGVHIGGEVLDDLHESGQRGGHPGRAGIEVDAPLRSDLFQQGVHAVLPPALRRRRTRPS